MKKDWKFNYKLLICDTIVWAIVILLVWWWRILADKSAVEEYIYIMMGMWAMWTGMSLLSKRYLVLLKHVSYKSSITRVLTLALITALIGYGVGEYMHYSRQVFAFSAALVGLGIWIYISVYYAYRYASNAEEETTVYDSREPVQLKQPPQQLDTQKGEVLEKAVTAVVGQNAMEWLKQHVALPWTSTKCIFKEPQSTIDQMEPFTVDCFVNLCKLNDLRGINHFFCTVNEHLPDNGKLVCRFTSRSQQKRDILKRFPKGINWCVYVVFFVVRRVLPKLFLTHRLYFDITNGKKRVLTLTEVLGRLYFCGFAVDDVQLCGHETFVLAHRVKQPEPQHSRRYGPFIKLPRIGKDGKIINVYKMRTMHPYAEFLQGYIYEKNHLQEGGKFANDMRISTLGAFMRKYWIDELPMIINLLKGEMKLVGVRPLSRQYFGLYTKELQELRTQFLPGLLPPFYVDMPKTLEEVQASEMKYLRACQRDGVWKTDMKYMWGIVYTILFKKARSH